MARTMTTSNKYSFLLDFHFGKNLRDPVCDALMFRHLLFYLSFAPVKRFYPCTQFQKKWANCRISIVNVVFE